MVSNEKGNSVNALRAMFEQSASEVKTEFKPNIVKTNTMKRISEPPKLSALQGLQVKTEQKDETRGSSSQAKKVAGTGFTEKELPKGKLNTAMFEQQNTEPEFKPLLPSQRKPKPVVRDAASIFQHQTSSVQDEAPIVKPKATATSPRMGKIDASFLNK